MDLGAFWSFLIKNKTLGGSLWLFKLLSLLNHWKVDSGTRSVSGLRFTAPFPGVGTGLIHSCCRAGRDESLSEGSKAAVSSQHGMLQDGFRTADADFVFSRAFEPPWIFKIFFQAFLFFTLADKTPAGKQPLSQMFLKCRMGTKSRVCCVMALDTSVFFKACF